MFVYTIQPVVKPVVQPVVQPGLTTGWTNSGFRFRESCSSVYNYTVVKLVVSCKWGISNTVHRLSLYAWWRTTPICDMASNIVTDLVNTECSTTNGWMIWHILNYHLFTAEPAFVVCKTINCMHQTGPKKVASSSVRNRNWSEDKCTAWNQPAVY